MLKASINDYSRRRRLGLAALASAFAAACSGGGTEPPPPPPVPTVAVVVMTSPASAPLFGALGRTVQFTAEPRDSTGAVVTGKTLTWSSDNSAVAQVNASGLVTAVGNGSTTIRASVSGKTGSLGVTVGQVTTQVVVTPGTKSFGAKGSTQQLAGEARDSTGNAIAGKVFAWVSTNTAVATVGATTGLVTSVADGTTQIDAAVDGVTGSATVTVGILVATVTVSPGSKTFNAVGSTQQFTATVVDSNSNAVAATVTWASTNTGFFTIDPASGLATSVANGTAQAQATAGGKTGSASVTVDILVNSLAVTPDTVVFTRVGTGRLFTVTALDANNVPIANAGVSWVSRNTAFVTVNSSGTATSVADGATYVVATATSNALAKDSVLVTVTAIANAVSVSPASTAFGAIGSTQQLTATVKDSGNTTIPGRSVTWTNVTASGAATVNGTGLVTSAAVGSETIRASATGPAGPITTDVAVTVTQVVATVTVTSSNGVNPDTLYTTTRTRQFNAAAADSNGNAIPSATFTWASTVPATATVDATGVVTAVADGTSSIQATSGTKTGSRSMLVRRYAETFTLAPPSASISTLAGTQLFTGTAQDSVGTNLTIGWSSQSTAVLTVSPAAGTSTTATATGNGSTNVVMSAGTRTAQSLVTVTNQIPTTAAVSIGNNFFKSGRNNTQNPAVDTVAVGGTVTWTWNANNGGILHSVESLGPPSFTSSTIKASGSYPFTFTVAGTYQYDCAVHGSLMTGRVVVR